MRLLVCIAALTLSAVPAMAQQPGERAADFEQALARVIDHAVLRADHVHGLIWRAFGLRGRRDVHGEARKQKLDACQSRQRHLH